ncbi:MAG TPA: D-alanyl-D-alanine carboxypeptidase [Candidatus Dormibacteraeota bacterium]|nr:D-alanyl-D-alanine carboxypeptidase [Candidatus Dormibacteraeota bacterium]
MSLIEPRRGPGRWVAGVPVVLVVLLVALALFQYFRAVPAVAARPSVPSSAGADGTAPALPWPAKGAGAVGATDIGLLGVGGATTPQPMFSVAKIMTALVLLDDKPLQPGEQGEAITVDASDVESYRRRLAGGESVVKVQAGEKISEYQALEGLLVPSGNNIGELLGKWDAGSEAAMVIKLNARAAALHLVNTRFDDVSGVSVKTVSVPSELVVLAGLALKNPVITAIVSQKQAELPVAGVVYNVDYALGQENIIGIKTGSSPEGGANFVFASSYALAGRPVTILGAVMGLTTLDEAFTASKALIVAVRPNLRIKHILTGNQTVGHYVTPWGSRTDIVAKDGLDVIIWPGIIVRTHFEARPVNPPVAAKAVVGTFSVKGGDQVLMTTLLTDTALTKPPTRYKLFRSDF